MEIGAFTFADVSLDPRAHEAAQRVPELIEQIALADEVGLDVFAIGETHCPEFTAPAPVVLLAVAAGRTSRIRLSGTVTVLGSEDPVRAFERYAMLDALSGGRAEMMAGHGGLLDSFRVFGYKLDDDDRLFSEKLNILLAQRTGKSVDWSGRHRKPLENKLVHKRPVQEPLPVWLAADGSPGSIVRAGQLGLPLALGIEGGRSARLPSMLWLYQDVLFEADHPPCPVAITVSGFVADTSQQAAALCCPGDADGLSGSGGERATRPMSREDFDFERGPGGPHAVGSPQQVTEQILHLYETFGHQRTVLRLASPSIGHRDVMRAIELLGTEVAPAVRTEIARRESVVSIPRDLS